MVDASRQARSHPVAGRDASVRDGHRVVVRRPVVIASAFALGLGIVYICSPLMGGDLSAQFAHADFARAHPLTPVDLRWFGGITPYAYSLWTPPLMALIGVRVTGVLATVGAVALFTCVLGRAGARRPQAGGVAAAVTFTSSLVEGRVTFACGMTCGLAAVVLLAGPTARPRDRSAAGALAILAGAASPVVSVFLLLGSGALILRRRFADAAVLSASVLPLGLVAWLFSDGGRQVFGANELVRALLATALVGVLVPARFPILRLGAGLALVMVLVAVAVPTPLGSNSARLSLLLAVPLVAAFVEVRGGLVPVAVLAVVVVQSPVTFGTLAGAGRPVTRASYFAPLERELADVGRTGRVEVPELTGHWDAAYLARRVPLARGWLRQTDTKLNDDVFYRRVPTAGSYRTFLDRNAVQFVAVADARATFYGRREVALIQAGLDYLRPLWRDEHWTLYEVATPTPIVAEPGALLAYRPDRVVLTAPADTQVSVRIRWFDWFTVTGPAGGHACLEPVAGGVVLHSAAAGTYEIGSGLTGRSVRC